MLGKGYKVLCIGSGGVRGLAFIGALKRVDYSSIQEYCGISIGSVLSMCLAVGYSPSDIEELALKTDYKKLVRFSAENLFNFKEKRGLMDTGGLRVFLGELLKGKGYSPESRLKDIPNLGVVVSNLNDQRGELWKGTEDGVVDSVIASAAIPLMMEPYIKEGKYYVDGCVFVDCASCLHEDPSSCYSLTLYSEEKYEVKTMGKYLESILQGPRKDRWKRYFDGRPEGSYLKICLNDVNTMEFDMTIEKRKSIINSIQCE